MHQTLQEFCLRTGRKSLLDQWSAAHNAPLTPRQVSYGSKRKVWWRCPSGHLWQAQVRSRSHGSGCPVCANRAVAPGQNDLASAAPLLAAEWHPTRNGTLTPGAVLAGTHQSAWWRCPKGHEWQARVSSRVAGSGCPYCTGKKVLPGFNDLESRFPAVAAQWHPTRNGDLTPSQVTYASNRKVWWRCPRGHDYQAAIGGRTVSGSGCPYCTRKKVLPGFNDLATLHPALAAQWHPHLNNGLTPEMLTPGSHRLVWWQCGLGHVWKAAVYSRTGGSKCGCPVCAGKVKPRAGPALELPLPATETHTQGGIEDEESA